MKNPDGCSRTFTPYIPSREDTAQRDLAAKCRRVKGWRKILSYRKNGADYLNTEHDYALMRGDLGTGRKRTMLGMEAKTLNEAYEAKFIKDKTPRLWRWKWLKPTA
jgi:hypothetical protein